MRGLDVLEPGEWIVGIASWVIQDGNYADFAIGEQRRFALEFHSENLRTIAPTIRRATPLGEALYEVAAEVVFGADDLVLLDFGLLAYSDHQDPAARRGEWRAGSVGLQVDPFFYFETHARQEAVPPAVYTWTLTGIWRQTAPYVPKPGAHPNLLVRDPTRLGYAWLERTDAWSDDDGNAEYLLRCRVETDAPTRRL